MPQLLMGEYEQQQNSLQEQTREPQVMIGTPPPSSSVSDNPTPLLVIPSTPQPATITTPLCQPTPAHTGPLDKQTIKQEVKQLESRFLGLAKCTYEALVKMKVDIGDFRAHLTSLDVVRLSTHREFIDCHVMKVNQGTTFHDLWVRLNVYWNFLNFDLLEHIVNSFSIEGVKHEMESYVHDLQSFRRATRVCDFIDCWPALEQSPPKTALRKFVVKMKLKWNKCTLEDLETLKGVITHKFFLPRFALQLRKIKKGCIAITWLIPAPFVKPLLEAIQSTSSEFFMEHKIKTITVDGQDYYPSPISRSSGYLDTSESPPVGVSPSKGEKLHPSKLPITSKTQKFMTGSHIKPRSKERLLQPHVQSVAPSPKIEQLGIPRHDPIHQALLGSLGKLQRETYTAETTLTPIASKHFDLPTSMLSYSRVARSFDDDEYVYVKQKCVDKVSYPVKLLPSTEQYLSKAEVEADPSLPTKYRDYLSSTPAIRAAMYTPFNAKASTEVFTWSQLTGSPPPTTMTELFTTFTLKSLVGYLSTHPLYRKQQLEVTSFSDLPPDVYKQFLGLCRTAYEGILNRQQLVFSASHLPTGFTLLGLMQEVPQMYTQGREFYYHFTHLTLQEFLSAFHISQLPPDEQTKLIQKHLASGHCRMTMRYVAGLKHFANVPPEIIWKLREICGNNLNLLHWLFECKDTSVTTTTLGSDEMVVRPRYSWTPLDYYVTGHVISHSNCPWRLLFNRSSMDNEKFDLFCQGCATSLGTRCEGYISYADFSVSDITSKHMASFVSIPPHILQGMKMLDLSGNKLGGSACDMLAKVVPSMSRLEVLWLNHNPMRSGGAVEVIRSLCGSGVKELSLNNTGIGGPDCEALVKLLQSTHSLGSLYIDKNNLSSESVASIITGLSQNNCLTDLNISDSHFSMSNTLHLSSLLREHSKCTLTRLVVQDCHISSEGAVELAAALCKNTTLQTLDVSGNPIGEHVEGVAAVASMLVENKSLTQLELKHCHISGQGTGELAAALYKSSTLKFLALDSNPIGVKGASSMSDMLQHNTSLTRLSVMCDDSVGVEGVCQLIYGVKYNQTLEGLYLPKRYKSVISDHRIHWL